jgi:hypothetical protein
MKLEDSMTVTIIAGVPGSRKTQAMLTEVLTIPRRYLVASPRIDLISEYHDFICGEAQRLGLRIPEMGDAHGKTKRRGNVQRQINDAVTELKNSSHAVLFVTHEGLRTSNLDMLAGWHARIDEVPDSLLSDSFSASAAYHYLEEFFDLEPVGDGKWSHVLPREGTSAPNTRQLMRDDVLNRLAAFHKQVRSERGVLVDVGDWQDAKGGRKIRWWSLWTPLALENFASVKMTAASFETSLCYRACTHWFSERLSFKDERIGFDVVRANPQVRIHFFTQGHTGSTAFWQGDQGSLCMNRVARHLDTVPGIGFWSGNDSVRTYLRHWVQGNMVLPKLAGTNTLIDKTSCAFIYSNKAQDADAAVLEVFNLNREEIRQARELEDIFQFVMRGAIRRPDFGGEYNVYLYDRTQAMALEQYLRKHRITDDVTLVGVREAGILDEADLSLRKGRRGEVDSLSEAERTDAKKAKAKERQRRHREGKKHAESLAGVPQRRPGRPPKRNTGTGSSAEPVG